MPAKDVFAETVETYRSEAGAEAFVAKELPFGDARNERAYQALEGLDIRGCRTLDVGCGFGRDVGDFRRRGAEAYGCDVSEPLLVRAEREVGPYFKVHNFRDDVALPYGGGFDLIWCCAVLVHVPRDELEAVLKRMWDALKEGGRLVIYSKSGAGEKFSSNLGEGLTRVMVYYRVEEILNLMKPWGACVEIAEDGHSETAFGEPMLLIRVRKPG